MREWVSTVLTEHQVLLVVLLPMSLGLVIGGLNRHSRKALRQCCHHRYQMQAVHVLEQLPLLPGDALRFSYLRKINPYVFEEALLLSFERLGYQIVRNPRYSHDGGIDGQVLIDRQRYFVQAKRYRHAINPAHVREFATLLRVKRCSGFFIHTGRTGKQSRQLEKQYPHLKIISGAPLLKLLAGKVRFHSPSLGKT